MGEERQTIKLLAYFPDLQGAVRFGRDGSVRIQLEIPASHRLNAIALLALMDEVLEFQVAVADETVLPEKTKRKSVIEAAPPTLVNGEASGEELRVES